MPIEAPGLADYLAPAFAAALETAGIDGFEALWRLDLPWLAAPQTRRGGACEVGLMQFPDGAHYIVKRQRGQLRRSGRHPLRGVPRAQHEFINLQRCRRFGVAVPEPVYFARRCRPDGVHTVLVTRALVGYGALNAALSGPGRRAVIQAVAQALARLHGAGMRHNSLYPKHVWVADALWDGAALASEQAGVYFIDWESGHRTWSRRRAMLRDLDSLNRHSDGWRRTERLAFLHSYLGAAGALPVLRALWRTLSTRAAP